MNNNYDKNIGYLRKPKMLVFKQKNRTLSQGYSAIFICDNKKGNAELAKMEDPKHNEWEKGWYPDVEKAASIKRI